MKFSNTRGYSKHLEPKTQQDIVDLRYPQEQTKTVFFDGDKLPALHEGFEDSDQFARFTHTTLRMRNPMYEWQFSTCDPQENSLTWNRKLSAKQVARYNLQEKSNVIADLLYSSDECVGVRISVENGIETASSANVLEEKPTLKLVYKPR